jgi:steroid delta-isomerase-like uncharacterized protein
MPTEETRKVLERAMELGMENYEQIADELLADDHINHGVEDDYGREGWKKRNAEFLDAFSDLDWHVEAALADGDTGSIRYTVRGVHSGDFENIPATGRKISITGATFYRVENGKVAETWALPDRLAFVQQLGITLGLPIES